MARVPTFAEIGERIRQSRVSKGYDQADLADVLKVSRPVVTKIENGNKAINSIELKKIADFLNVSIDSLTANVANETLAVRFRDQKDNEAFLDAVQNIEGVIHSVIGQLKLGCGKNA